MDFTNTKSLVESRTFWTQALGLTSLVASTLGVSSAVPWASDPHTVDTILHAVSIASFVGGIYFHKTSTKTVTSIFPK